MKKILFDFKRSLLFCVILGGAIFIQGCIGAHKEESINEEENDSIKIEDSTEIANEAMDGMLNLVRREREIRDSFEAADRASETSNEDNYSVQYKVYYKYCDLCDKKRSFSYKLIDGNDDDLHQAAATILSRQGNVQYLFGGDSEDCSQSTTGNHRWEERSNVKTLYLEKDPVDGHFKKRD
jgi:hypothetical protein